MLARITNATKTTTILNLVLIFPHLCVEAFAD
jgi:hypothetical protein